MFRFSIRLAAAAALPIVCLAVSTKTWLTSTFGDFEKGEWKGVSVRSDGRVALAPKKAELFDSTLGYLWSLASDSKGVLYAGGGPGARVYRVANGKGEKIAEFEGVEVHAIAIDKQDRVYCATFPDSKIYRLNGTSKPELFYDPKLKYIWAMLFGPDGGLYVATGDQGEIRRVMPDGSASVFFKSEDTHVRSMAFDGKDLIAGTDPSGLVIRVHPDRRGFVLYQLPKREITAIAVAKDGSVYASGAGNPGAGGGPGSPGVALEQPVVRPAAAANPAAPGGGGAIVVAASPNVTPPVAAAPRVPPLTGGSVVYRIDAANVPSRVWSHAKDVVYAIAFDAEGRPVLGTGNKGNLYRIDTPSLYTALLNVDADQLTSLLPGSKGVLYAASANVGKIFRFGPDLETQGTVTSEVFDSGAFSNWGRLMQYGEARHGRIELESRSGNLDRPSHFWSDWTNGAPPAARFVQWRATLNGDGANSPVLDSVEQAYLARNIAPRVEEIESTPPNYKFPDPLVANILKRAPATLTLPPMGRHMVNPASSGSDGEASSMTWAKGWIGVRWTAGDENGDPLCYKLEIRGVNESDWKPLKQSLNERHFSFDSTAFPDGEYRIRVTASDAPGNPPGDALTGDLVSSPILIDNTQPVITGLDTVKGGAGFSVRWKAADARSVIKLAEYSVDGGEWQQVDPVTHLSDRLSLEYSLTLDELNPGEHTIAVRVTDEYDNTAVAKLVTRR